MNLQIFKEKFSTFLSEKKVFREDIAQFREDRMNEQAQNPRKASVLILMIWKENQIVLPLILRTESKGVHSAQMAFAGGRKETTDISDIHTALRETQEEIGVIINENEILGTLTDFYIPPSNSMVTPVVAFTTQKIDYQLDSGEVQKVFEVPITHFLTPKNQIIQKMTLPNGLSLQTPAYQLEDQIVWGATAFMLGEFLSIYEKVLEIIDSK